MAGRSWKRSLQLGNSGGDDRDPNPRRLTDPPNSASLGPMVSTDADILDRFASINIWKRGSEGAPHKPLLLLYALAALQRGEDRLIPFARIEEHVGRLLHNFGPPRATRPEYPF